MKASDIFTTKDRVMAVIGAVILAAIARAFRRRSAHALGTK